MTIFIEDSLTSAEAMFCLRALLVKLVSLIRTRWSDLYETGRKHFQLGNLTTVPHYENLPTFAPSGLDPPTYYYNNLGRGVALMLTWGVNVDHSPADMGKL